MVEKNHLTSAGTGFFCCYPHGSGSPHGRWHRIRCWLVIVSYFWSWLVSGFWSWIGVGFAVRLFKLGLCVWFGGGTDKGIQCLLSSPRGERGSSASPSGSSSDCLASSRPTGSGDRFLLNGSAPTPPSSTDALAGGGHEPYKWAACPELSQKSKKEKEKEKWNDTTLHYTLLT